jgi:hypothetical protein
VRTGRPTPYWTLAHRDVPAADPAGDVLSSRTVHKLYRRQWLLDLGARFPEGRVRLEDHVFTAQVLPHARGVSVLASYPCYRWIHRPDGTNSSDMVVDPGVYWEFYSGVLRTFEREAGPGRMLDEARRHAALQSFSRFPLRELHAMSEPQRSALMDAVHAYVAEQVPASLDPSLPVLKRLRLQALRAGDAATFLTLHEASSRLTSHAVLAGADTGWQDGRVTLHATSELVQRDASPTGTARTVAAAVRRVGDDVLVPESLLGGATPSADDRTLLRADRGSLELTLRHRESGVEWPLPGDADTAVVALGPGGAKGAVGLRARVSVVLDPATAAFGRPLGPGIWDVLARSQFLGENQTRRLPAPRPAEGQGSVALPAAPVPFAGADGDLEGLLYRTADATLALKVTDPAALLARRPRVTSFSWTGDRLTLRVALGEIHEPAELVVRPRGAAPDDEGLAVPVQGGAATLGLDDGVLASWSGPVLDLFVRGRGAGRTGDGHSAAEQRLGYDVPVEDGDDGNHLVSVYPTAHGSASLKRLAVRPSRRTGGRRLFGRFVSRA